MKYLYRFCFSLLFCVPLLLFSQVIFSKGGMSFHYFCFDTNIDWWHFLVTTVKNRGIFPFWTNKVFMGFPLIANIEQGFFYPFNWIGFIFPLNIAFNLNLFIHIVAGVFFTYLFCRQISISRFSALCGGWVFIMNGIVLQNYIHLFWITSIVWLPLLLYFIEKIFSQPPELRIKYVILAGLTLGIQSLTGMFQTFYYTFILSVLYFLFKVFFYAKNFRIQEKILFPLLIVSISLGIFAIQFFPAYELVSHSARAGLSYQEIVHPPGESLGLKNFIEMLFPNYRQVNYVRAFTHHYFGIMVFILIFTSFLSFKKNRYIQFLSSASLFSIIFALGKHTPFYHLIYQMHLPGFSVLKDPTRANVIFMFSFSVLTAFGMDKMIKTNAARERRRISFLAISVYLFIAIAAFLYLRNKYLAFSTFPVNENILNPEKFPLSFLQYLHFMEWREYCILLLLGLVFFISLYLFYNNKIINISKFRSILAIIIFLDLYLFRMVEVPFRNSIVDKDVVPLTKIPFTVEFLKKDDGLYRTVSVNNNSIYTKIENRGISWEKWMTRQEVSQILYERNNLLEDTPLYYFLDSVNGRAVAPPRRYLEWTKGDLNISAMQNKNYFSFLYFSNLLKLSNVKYIIIPKDAINVLKR